MISIIIIIFMSSKCLANEIISRIMVWFPIYRYSNEEKVTYLGLFAEIAATVIQLTLDSDPYVHAVSLDMNPRECFFEYTEICVQFVVRHLFLIDY